MMIARFTILLVLATATSACSTRQLSDAASGSTAQRLVTYSLERFVAQIANQPEMKTLTGQTIRLTVHFFRHHPLLDYADNLLRHEFESRYHVKWANPEVIAPIEVSVFFNSIGTDHDNYGLTIPSLGLIGASAARVNVLAIDMFHGITEGYAVIKNTYSNELLRSKKLLSRVRADNVATPILDFPVNQLD